MELMHTSHVPAGEGPFPTIFALHGWGANAHDLLGLAPHLHGGRALVLCPQGPVPVPVGDGMVGYGWFPLGGGREVDPDDFEKGGLLLRSFVEEAFERFPIDRRKVVVMGFSQGGVMAYDLVLRNPEVFAALVALSSWLPEDVAARVADKGETGLAALPALVMHGTQDPMIPVDRARDSRDRLIRLGVSPAYHEYEMGHEIHPEALRTMVQWLEEKVLTPVMVA